MRLRVHHVTTYEYESVKRGVTQSLRLWPSESDGQTTLDWSVNVDGGSRGAAFRDGAGDWIETVAMLGQVPSLTVDARGEVRTTDTNGILRGHRERVPPMTYLRSTRATEANDALKDLARSVGHDGQSDIDRAHALNAAIREAIDYTPGETDEATTAADALALGKGVCQDHSHAIIACAHVLGMPARYVIGYLHAIEGASEASHAWSELWIDGLGWVGFDASNGVSPDENYVRVGSGFDSTDAAPIRGMSRGPGGETMTVDVEVEQIDD